MSFIKAALTASLFAAVGITAAQAQNEAFPQFSSVTNGPDQINEGNLDIHWSFPIFRKPGRNGHDYVVTLSYDSAGIYQPYGNGAGQGPDRSFSAQIAPGGLNIFTGGFAQYGFKFSSGAERGGSLANTPSPNVCNVSLLNLPPTAAPVTPLMTDAFGWAFTDASGVQHSFSGAYYKQPGCYSNPTWYPQGPVTMSGPVRADDGSGYILTLSGQGTAGAGQYTAIVTTPSGARYQIQPNGDSSFNVLTDPNGNVSGWTQPDLSADAAGTATAPSDTLGLYPLTVAIPNSIGLGQQSISGLALGNNPPPPAIGTVLPWTTYQYVDSNGATQTVTVNIKAYYLATAFGCQATNNGLNGLVGQADYINPVQMLVDSIVYPDGSKYSLTYEPTPAGASPAASPPAGVQPVTGRLKSATLPTGGTITYTYSGPHDGANCFDYNATQLTRTTSDGDVRTYVRTPAILPNAVNNSSQTVIDDAYTHKVVNFQTYTFATPPTYASLGTTQPPIYYETSRSITDKTQGIVIQTSTLCYNGAAAPCDSTPVTPPILRRTAITQNNFGQQSKTDKFYNATGDITEEDLYDFGQGAPGPLLKKTLTAYAALGNNILDKPASATVYDGAGHQTAQTLFGYDEAPLVATSGVPKHVAVSGSRGNVTTTRRWLNTTGGYLTSTQTYDDTGNIVTRTDPKGNVTTQVYDDNFTDHVNRNSRAFETKTILPATTDNLSGTPITQTTTSTYDANTSLKTHLTDANGNPTDLAYDSMDRVVKTILPPDANGNRAETDVTHVNPNTVTQVKSITPPGVLQ
jgi:YD repeat-containing protein